MMASSRSLSFDPLVLLEQLDEQELATFKTILSNLGKQQELWRVSQEEMTNASRQRLAELMERHGQRHQMEMVTMQVFKQMNRMDLSEQAREQAKDRLGASSAEEEPRKRPREMTTTWRFPILPPGDEYKGYLQEPATEAQYKHVMKEKFSQLWQSSPGLGNRESINAFSRKYEPLIPFCHPRAFEAPFPQTVVLQGPAGVGKSALALKLLRDWLDRGLGLPFQFAFYLSCPELSRLRCLCTFSELLTRDCPAQLQEQLLRGVAQAHHVLLLLDGLDQLCVPPGTLVSDLCGDWRRPKMPAVLLGSLLKRKLLPRATLLVTTRPRALRELRILVEQPLLVHVEGFSEAELRDYFLKHFQDEAWALRALRAMQANATLTRLAAAPAVCWLVCTCLQGELQRGEDPATACVTTTALFVRFLCSRLPREPALCAPLQALALLAARGVWEQVPGFPASDLDTLGLKEPDLHPFLDAGVLRQNPGQAHSFSFVHLSMQQCLGALSCLLEAEEGRQDVRGAPDLFIEKLRAENPGLAQTGRFLFGLLNPKSVQELEAAFSCHLSTRIRQKLLPGRPDSKGKDAATGRSVLATLEPAEVLYCLHESQDTTLVTEAVAAFQELNLHLKDHSDLAQFAFCLQHCRGLQELSLQVDKGVFLEEAATKESKDETRSQREGDVLLHWTELCSVLSSNRDLSSLYISQSVLSAASVRILCEQASAASCQLEKLVLRNTSPADAYGALCLAVSGHQTLTHLILQGGDGPDMIPALCKVLKHPSCRLQYLRLVSCSVPAQQWGELALALATNLSLTCLNLMNNKLLDEDAKLFCKALRHPQCPLRKLALENCHLTDTPCKELRSALVINQRLTHLCLAENELGDSGVIILCQALSYPECNLQMLVLWCCSLTSKGCAQVSALLRLKSSLTYLDLGLNQLGIAGMRALCQALKQPQCNLKSLWLWGCAIPPFSCADLASALVVNRSLTTLDLGQNALGFSGLKILCDAVRVPSCPLQSLRLKLDETDMHVQKLLRETREGNPRLTIENDSRDPRRPRPSACDFMS